MTEKKTCEICGEGGFRGERGLKIHKSHNHPEEHSKQKEEEARKEYADKEYGCPYCFKGYDTERKLKIHVRQAHVAEKYGEEDIETRDEEDFEVTYICPECENKQPHKIGCDECGYTGQFQKVSEG